MKLLTTNFLTCAVKTCKTSPSSFPLHFKDAQLERSVIDFNPLFIRNILPRLDWQVLQITANELGLGALLPETNPLDNETETETEVETGADGQAMDVEGGNTITAQTKEGEEEMFKKLHNLLLETSVVEGKLCCANCGFEYPIKEGVGNFLLPAHLV